MKVSVMSFLRRLMAKKITVCSSPSKPAITVKGALPHGQGKGAVRVSLLYETNQLCKPLIRKPGVLSPLKNEGAKSQSPAIFTTFSISSAVRRYLSTW